MPAVRMGDGSVKFVSRNKRGVVGDLELPCGQCVGCRLERSRQWAMRCMHEASLHDSNCFITLTYDDAHLPAGGSLRYRDFQLFMKRLRKKFEGVSFYVGGEYGETTARPHFHACLFNMDFPDRLPMPGCSPGYKLWRSPLLESLWPLGNSSVGNVTFQSAAYIARYCVSKRTGQEAESYYAVPEFIDEEGNSRSSVTPEFNHMSLKPAIAKRWLGKFLLDVYPNDYVVVNGVKVRPPKYYDRLMESTDDQEFSFIKSERENLAYTLRADNTVARLAVKETVHKARLSMLKRSFL